MRDNIGVWTALMCVTSCRIPTSASTNQGHAQGDLIARGGLIHEAKPAPEVEILIAHDRIAARVQDPGFRFQGAGCRVQSAGFRIQGSGFRVQGSGFRVQGSGFRVQSPEVEVLVAHDRNAANRHHPSYLTQCIS